MHLYKIERPDFAGYDQYVSAVVAALNEDDARRIHPMGHGKTRAHVPKGEEWISRDDVIVTLIGTATSNVSRGVIVAAFRAG